MSEARSSIDLSEFFNDDDSEGHRFVDFIKKRRGRVQKQKYLFMDCETDRLSFDVQLEKLPTPQVPTGSDTEKNKQKEPIENENNKADENTDIEKLTPGDIVANNPDFAKIPISSLNTENENPRRSPNRSPRSNFAALRRSNGTIVPSDRLRRMSIRNSVKKLTAGRRTLLQEFESTIEGTNFDPPICSTPISQPGENLPPPSSNIVENPDNENVVPNTAKTTVTSETCCGHTDTLIRSLQCKDDELKSYLESILDRTLSKLNDHSKAIRENSKHKAKADISKNSTQSKRTFTIEKGSIPGQLLLTPGRSTGDLENENSKIQTSNTRSINTRMHLKSQYCSQECDKLDCQKPPCPSFSKQRKTSLQKDQSVNNDIPNSPHNTQLSIVFPTQNIEIPETQSQANNGNNTVIIQSGTDKNVFIIPFNQTCKDNNEKTSGAIGENKQFESHSAIQTASLQEAEDNLRLTDILTDDEEQNLKPSTEKNSEMPLNLALGSRNLRKRRLRKRISSSRKIQADNLQQSTDTETEVQPTCQSVKSVTIHKSKPLNKAPGIPLNGEEYAQDLARMTKCEILDLRKRNSMGQIFLIKGRKSRLSQEEVNRKAHQLADQIEKELLKRLLEEGTGNNYSEIDQTKAENEILPAPSNFIDSFDNTNVLELVDEKSSDRVKFISNGSKQRKPRKKKIPDILKQYLEVSKKYSKKSRLSKSKLKRSLYNTQDLNYDNVNSEEGISALENHSDQRTHISSLPYVKSPPKSNEIASTTPKVVSPPPLILSSFECEREKSERNNFEDLSLPPPPPGFESESRLNSSCNINPYTTNVTLQVGPAVSKNEASKTSHCESNDGIFKKPLKPAPKRKNKAKGASTTLKQSTADKQQSIKSTADIIPGGSPLKPAPKRKHQKAKGTSSTSKESTDDKQQSINSSADITPGGSLRRSKRGQVPKQQEPILEILYQQILRKKEKLAEYEKRRRKLEIIKQREIERNSVKAVKSINNENSKKSKSKEYLPPEVQESSGDLRRSNSDAAKSTKKLVKRKTKPSNKASPSMKKSENRSKDPEIVPSNNTIHCRHLEFLSPPPIEYFNNMFDQLKQTTLKTIPDANNAPTTKDGPPHQKIKPLRVRVRRLKSTATSPVTENSSVSSTSTNSNNELISWLKSMSQTGNDYQPNQVFNEMRISTAANLCFTELQGVEYAFYDTDEKASCGYLRFKPRQTKPAKRAKRYQLHFINLLGTFLIRVNNDESILNVGDMVEISKTAYYSIENITDDIGVLVVHKN